MDDADDPRIFMYREYPMPPFQRYALTLEPSQEAPYYVASNVDSSVADAGWLGALWAHLAEPTLRRDSDESTPGMIAELAGMVPPGHPDHLEEATRVFPHGSVGVDPHAEEE